MESGGFSNQRRGGSGGRGGGQRGGGRGRGGGQGGKKKNKVNYIQLNLQQLFFFYGSLLDEATIKQIYTECNHDTNKAIGVLKGMTGFDPNDEPEDTAQTAATETDKSEEPSPSQKPKTGFSYKEINGDLFKCPPDSCLCHCVSHCLAMGKGIAVIFKKQYGGVDELKQQDKPVGDVAVLSRNGVFVYYLITKDVYWNKPTYQDLKSSLVAMRDHMVKNGATKIAMPKIGCGLDGLLWKHVRAIIKEVFSSTDIQVEVYYM